MNTTNDAQDFASDLRRKETQGQVDLDLLTKLNLILQIAQAMNINVVALMPLLDLMSEDPVLSATAAKLQELLAAIRAEQAVTNTRLATLEEGQAPVVTLLRQIVAGQKAITDAQAEAQREQREIKDLLHKIATELNLPL